MTVPYYQNMVRGFDQHNDNNPVATNGLYVRTGSGPDHESIPILSEAPDPYTLTYPQTRYAVNDPRGPLWLDYQPFFMMDDKHTHFYERELYCTMSVWDRPVIKQGDNYEVTLHEHPYSCLLYTSPSPRDRTRSRMPSSA